MFKKIGKNLQGRNFLKVSQQYRVPIFCGATSDSEIGLDLLVYRKSGGPNIILDEIGDVDKFAGIIERYDIHGTIILGGGVPRNWAQQVFPYLDQVYQDEGKKFKGYNYSIRFHSATPYDGGLSGCTIKESISWGKYSVGSQHQSVWGDASIYFPLIMTGLLQRIHRLGIKIK